VKTLYVVGGKRKKDDFRLQEWNRFEKGLIVRVRPEAGASELCVEYVTPPEVCAEAESPSKLFKAGTLLGARLCVCTQTEVMAYELPTLRRISYVSLPCFNDLHHVYPTPDGNYLVAIAGLDMVIEITPDGTILREWDVLGETPWERYSRDTDYRKVLTTKPHRSHPNYVFQANGQVWVTRFEQKDSISLTKPDKRINIAVERPHDGIVYREWVYYTTVDGHVVVADLKTTQVLRVVNLNEISTKSDMTLGWCRGLAVLDENRIIVGFSRLRPTKWRENVRWIKRSMGMQAGTLPTRITLYDLKCQKIAWEKNLEDTGMGAIFSIHALME
jgi:hypothetical protein